MNQLTRFIPRTSLVAMLSVAGLLGALVAAASPVSAAGAASFSLSPEKTSATGSEGLDLSVYVDSGAVTINAVEPELRYDPELLQMQSVDGNGSGFDVAAPVSNEKGSLRLPRGKATPGVTGRQKVATVKFRVIGASDSATVTFGDKSSILTLDGAKEVWNGQSGGGRYVLSQPGDRAESPDLATAAYPVAVVVQDKQGVSIEGASVTLGNGRTATTDAKGVAGFMNVPEGQYDATVTKGEQSERRTVTVQKGDANKVQEHAFTMAATAKKTLNLPYGFIAVLLAVVAAAIYAAWRWHKRIVAHHLAKQGTSGPDKN